jgi:AcrR family transcriptional regulator
MARLGSSETLDRMVERASRLFYAEGIRGVGVDRLVAEAEVTKATFYRYFPTKDDLVVAHVNYQAELIRTQLAAGRQTLQGRVAIEAFFGGLAGQICGPGFRGCPFINAAAEYPDHAHPVREAIDDYRVWLEGVFVELLTEAEHPGPAGAAGALVLLRDGAMVGGYLDDAAVVEAHLRAAISVLLDR